MVLVFGTICIDRVREVPRLPSPGGYVEISAEKDMLGGEAANTAYALSKWNAEFELWGNLVGDDLDGRLLGQLILEHGLVNEFGSNPNSGVDTPICDIYVTPDGERTMFGKGFSSMGRGVELSRLRFKRGGWFTAEPNMLSESESAVRLAMAAGMKLYLMDYLNPDSVPPGSYWQCSTDWVGTRNNMQRNVSWVQDWVAKTESFAILSDGPNGFVAGSPDLPIRAYPPYPAPIVIDTTGAGDMFRAGMLFGLSQGWHLDECLRFASAAGCLKCGALGATTVVPSISDVKKLIDEHPTISKQYARI
jgi:sugar/nucleoside kinase (ribokinase family)